MLTLTGGDTPADVSSVSLWVLVGVPIIVAALSVAGTILVQWLRNRGEQITRHDERQVEEADQQLAHAASTSTTEMRLAFASLRALIKEYRTRTHAQDARILLLEERCDQADQRVDQCERERIEDREQYERDRDELRQRIRQLEQRT